MKMRLGRQEAMLLAYTQLRKLRAVRTGELTGPLQLTRDQERELLHRMARSGLIARVRPGLYLVPAQLPLGGKKGMRSRDAQGQVFILDTPESPRQNHS